MKRLRAGLTAFNTLITGAIVLGMTILCLILSEKSARTESFRNFSGQLATAAAYLQSQDRLSLGWLEQMETAGQLHTAILDGGAPLFSVGLDPARDGTAAEAARRMARQDYGLPEKNQLFTCAFSMTDQGKAYFAGVAKIPKGRGALEITMLCPLDSLEQSFARLRLAAGLGAVLAVGLLGGFSWSFTGRLLRPIPARNVRLVIAGRGAGEELEQTVRGLMWLRGLGLLSCPVVIADVDLTPQGWELALRLTLRWPDLALWPASALEEYICEVRN